MTAVKNKVDARSFGPLKKGNQRKAEIVDAALRCLGSLGIHKTNYETIGQELGLKRAHVAYHFPEFDALYHAVLAKITATAQEIAIQQVKGALTPQDRAISTVQAAFIWAQRHPDQLSAFTVFMHWGTFDKGLRESYSEVRRLGRERLQQLLLECFPRMAVEQAVQVSRTMQTVTLGFLLSYAGTEDFEGLAEAQAGALSVIHGLLRPWM